MFFIILIIGYLIYLGWDSNQKTPQQTLAEIELANQQAIKRQEESKRRNDESIRQAEEVRNEWKRKYAKYLSSDRWKSVREKVLNKNNHKCQSCGELASQVHHRKYPRGHKRGDFAYENMSYLEALCKKCHMKRHRII
jgi:5-methylcytosine-specific restriction endonuclease McrA